MASRYQLVHSCVDARCGEDIHALQASAYDIELATFRRAIGKEAWRKLLARLSYDRYFPISRDQMVRYKRGVYRGVPAYFLEHSRIEYIFTMDGKVGPSFEDTLAKPPPRDNPAWTNAALERNWAPLERVRGADDMPQLRRPPPHLKAREYGTGAYGTVMPTDHAGLVFKITSDPTEAWFVAVALALKHFPPGIVRYRAVVQLPERHKGAPLFALWREEASFVGDTITSLGVFTRLFRGSATDAFVVRLNAFREAARLVRKTLKKAPGAVAKLPPAAPAVPVEALDRAVESIARLRGTARVTAALALCRSIAAQMRDARFSGALGAALAFYLEHGLLLADVHYGNVGVVRRDGQDAFVITDPGQVVALDGRYKGVRVPRLATKAAPRENPSWSMAGQAPTGVHGYAPFRDAYKRENAGVFWFATGDMESDPHFAPHHYDARVRAVVAHVQPLSMSRWMSLSKDPMPSPGYTILLNEQYVWRSKHDGTWRSSEGTQPRPRDIRRGIVRLVAQTGEVYPLVAAPFELATLFQIEMLPTILVALHVPTPRS